jgi:TusE/DsrC/DsvC family sulfur relay protein
MNLESTILYDNEGYLVDPEDWTPETAELLAASEGLDLGGEHWPILEFMRAYWRDHRITPDVRHVVEDLRQRKGWEKQRAKDHLFQLFPYGYVKQACRIAGMQRPRAWSTG